MKLLWRLSREAIRYKNLYVVAILSTLGLTAVNLAAPRVLSSMTGIVERGMDETSLRAIGVLTAILLALYLLGGRVTGLRLSAFGAELATDAARLPYLRETGVVLAGPAVNLALGLLLARLGQYTASGAHLSLCLFNLLPVRPLDGGRALCLLASWLLGPERGEAAARWGGALTALPLGGAGLWLTGRTGGSLWLLPASWGLLAAGLRELAGGARGIFCKKPLHF